MVGETLHAAAEAHLSEERERERDGRKKRVVIVAQINPPLNFYFSLQNKLKPSVARYHCQNLHRQFIISLTYLL